MNQPEPAKQLANRHVLLIAPRFFGCDKAIADELAQQGAAVDRLFDRPFDSPHMAAFTRYAPAVVARHATAMYRRQIEGFGRSAYDYILIVNGQTLATDLLRELRRRFPAAQLLLYLWDSIDNRRSVRANLDLADRCLSFDPVDARRYGMMLRPLFFARHFGESPAVTQDLDISFIGTAHTDRARVVKRVDAALPPDLRRFWYLYLQAPWVFHARKLFDPRMSGREKRDFTFLPMAGEDVRNVFFRSRAILDIEHPRQRGLTIRTFETIGARRKLITTNSGIRDYDFYDPRNICIIDRNAPHIDDERFFNEDYQPLPEATYRYYSIEGWLETVVNGATAV